MTVPGAQIDRIEHLRGLIERLSAPELTLGESKGLREGILTLLESGNDPATVERLNSPARTEYWPSEPGMRVAG